MLVFFLYHQCPMAEGQHPSPFIDHNSEENRKFVERLHVEMRMPNCNFAASPNLQGRVCCALNFTNGYTLERETSNEREWQKSSPLRAGLVACFPGVVVIGSQKAGTTVLHTYLSLHPSFNYPKYKELHAFDSNANFHNFGMAYLSNFKAVGSRDAGKYTNFESSPTYTASPLGCARMSQFLPPTTKFVLLLRNPVDRFWSEIQMRRRRVAYETELAWKILKNSLVVFTCVGDQLLFESISDTNDAAATDRFDTMKRCLPEEITKQASFHSSFYKEWYPWIREVGFDTFLSKCMVVGGKQDTLSELVRGGRGSEVEMLSNCVNGRPGFTGKYPDAEKILESEYKSLLPCVSLLDNNNDRSVVTTTSNEPIRKCEGKYCKCFPERTTSWSDLSKNFLWRGMYYFHLANCFQHIVPDRIFLIESEELRRNHSVVFESLARFLHVPSEPFMDTGRLSSQQVERAFVEIYPGFESASGWSINGTINSSPPEALKKKLISIYNAPNDALFELIDRRFELWEKL